MKIATAIRKLNAVNACSPGIEWLNAGNFETAQEAWNKCDRPDNMAWVIAKTIKKLGSKKHKKLVLTLCKCARTVLKRLPKDEKRPLIAIKTAEAWAGGDITLEDANKAGRSSAFQAASYAFQAAAAAAYRAASDAFQAAAASSSYLVSASASSYASSYAFQAAAAAAYTADYAFQFSSSASSAYQAASAAFLARTKAKKKLCKIIRNDFPDVDKFCKQKG